METANQTAGGQSAPGQSGMGQGGISQGGIGQSASSQGGSGTSATGHGTVRDTAAQVGNELKQDARQLGSAAQDRLTSEAEAHKGQIASQARSVSHALENAAGELRGGETPDWLRSAFQQSAQAIQRLADGVERKDPRELFNDLQTLGREHPGAFLGVCAVAGFAAARVFRAGTAGASSPTGGWSGASDTGGSGSFASQPSNQPAGTSAWSGGAV